jgi:hypothetical protein
MFFRRYVPVMILLLWGAVLSTLTATVAPLVAYLVRITCGISQYEIQLRKDILDLKKVGTGNEGYLAVHSFTAVAPLGPGGLSCVHIKNY